MIRLLLFNLAVDEDDPVLAFACGWIRQLASRCERIDVLTMRRGRQDLPDNVRVFSAGLEHGWSKPRRVAEFYRQLTRLLANRRYDACFAHMIPLFAGLGGPLLMARGVPITLWYTHPQRSWQLSLGQAFAWRIVSADESSYPYRSNRLRALGHGIETDFYTPRPDEGVKADMPLVLQVARLAHIKHQATTIQAVADLPMRLALIGGVQPGFPDDYETTLRGQIDKLDITSRAQLVGDQSREQTLGWYRRAAVAVNMTPPGSYDKAILESMACGVPTIVANPAFAPLLGDCKDLLLTDSPDDAAGLRQRIQAITQLSPAERAAIGAQLRENVVRQHSLPRLVERLMSVLETGELPA